MTSILDHKPPNIRSNLPNKNRGQLASSGNSSDRRSGCGTGTGTVWVNDPGGGWPGPGRGRSATKTGRFLCGTEMCRGRKKPKGPFGLKQMALATSWNCVLPAASEIE